MSQLPAPDPLPEREAPIDAQDFAGLRERSEPVVLRGLANHWPAVAAGREGPKAIVDYLTDLGSIRTVNALAAHPREGGRFFYKSDLTGLNFVTGRGQLETFLSDLLAAADMHDPPGLAVQSEFLDETMPAFLADNGLDLLPDVRPRIWIGNRIRVAPHYDVKENVAICVAGERRFTLFPPDQIANLYPGPFELTPAGTPVSMVDPYAPDLDRYPNFVKAWNSARQATLAPGDAIYMPYGWWHGVESLDPVSILVNYWWTEDEGAQRARPYDALVHALYAFRHMPPRERAIWRSMLDYYVFESAGDPAAHLPDHAKGVLGPPSPELFRHMRGIMDQVMRS